MKLILAMGALAALACATQAQAQTPSSMTVIVDNVRSSSGSVRAELCTSQTFLKNDCQYSASAAAHQGSTTIVFEDVPPGAYAIQAFHDQNDNHRVDRGAFGIPLEDVGFSRAPPAGAPRSRLHKSVVRILRRDARSDGQAAALPLAVSRGRLWLKP